MCTVDCVTGALGDTCAIRDWEESQQVMAVTDRVIWCSVSQSLASRDNLYYPSEEVASELQKLRERNVSQP